MLAHRRLILRGLSSEMIKQIPDDSLIFAYLDGDHSYEGCLADLKAIYSKVKSGGIIAGHDYLSPQYGVNKALKQYLFWTDKYTLEDVHVTYEDGDNSMVSFWFVKK